MQFPEIWSFSCFLWIYQLPSIVFGGHEHIYVRSFLCFYLWSNFLSTVQCAELEFTQQFNIISMTDMFYNSDPSRFSWILLMVNSKAKFKSSGGKAPPFRRFSKVNKSDECLFTRTSLQISYEQFAWRNWLRRYTPYMPQANTSLLNHSLSPIILISSWCTVIC
jgi:hypothetical protein